MYIKWKETIETISICLSILSFLTIAHTTLLVCTTYNTNYIESNSIKSMKNHDACQTTLWNLKLQIQNSMFMSPLLPNSHATISTQQPAYCFHKTNLLYNVNRNWAFFANIFPFQLWHCFSKHIINDHWLSSELQPSISPPVPSTHPQKPPCIFAKTTISMKFGYTK